jgi:GNAT superfamily N-acetyltransferase
MEFTIREATEIDAPGIDVLRGKDYSEPGALARHARYAHSIAVAHEQLLVAVDDDTIEIVGWSLAQRVAYREEVTHPGYYWRYVLVAPKATGQGIGNAFGEAVVAWLTTQGATEMYAVQRAASAPFGTAFGLELVDEPFQYVGITRGEWLLYRAAPFHTHDPAKSMNRPITAKSAFRE